jgi:hypothetical protein
MSKPFAYERFDVHACECDQCENPVRVTGEFDGKWIKAEDAINRDAVLTAQICTLELQLKEARAALDAERQPWIPVSEGLPHVRTLAFTPTDNRMLQHRIIPGGMFRQVATEATHWMPLPSDPPKVPA